MQLNNVTYHNNPYTEQAQATAEYDSAVWHLCLMRVDNRSKTGRIDHARGQLTPAALP